MSEGRVLADFVSKGRLLSFLKLVELALAGSVHPFGSDYKSDGCLKCCAVKLRCTILFKNFAYQMVQLGYTESSESILTEDYLNWMVHQGASDLRQPIRISKNQK